MNIPIELSVYEKTNLLPLKLKDYIFEKMAVPGREPEDPKPRRRGPENPESPPCGPEIPDPTLPGPCEPTPPKPKKDEPDKPDEGPDEPDEQDSFLAIKSEIIF